MQQKSLFKNSVYKCILSFANLVIPLIIGPYITKLLNVELYGAYNKVYAEFQFFLIFASFGIYTYGVREISKIRNDPQKVSRLFTNLFVLGIITNLIVGIIYTVYALTNSQGVTTQIYLVFLIQIVANIFYMEFLNESLENYRYITIKTIIVRVIYLGLILLFVRKPEDIIPYALVISFIQFLNNIISFIYIKRFVKFDFHGIKIFQFIKPLFLVLVLTNIDLLYSQLDQVMLGKFAGDVEVTGYFIPYNIVSMLASIPYSVIFVSIPRLSYVLRGEGIDSYRHTLNTAIASLLFIIVPMCFGVAVLSAEVIDLYAGSKYSGLVPTLALAAFVRIIVSMVSVLTHLVLYVHDKEKIIIRISAAFGIANLVMNSALAAAEVLTPFTAMFTTGIAQLGILITQYFYIQKKMDFTVPFFTKQNLTYFALSVCFIPIAYGVRKIDFGFYVNIPVIMVLCAGLYGGVLLAKKDPSLYILIDKLLGKFIRKKR